MRKRVFDDAAALPSAVFAGVESAVTISEEVSPRPLNLLMRWMGSTIADPRSVAGLYN